MVTEIEPCVGLMGGASAVRRFAQIHFYLVFTKM